MNWRNWLRISAAIGIALPASVLIYLGLNVSLDLWVAGLIAGLGCVGVVVMIFRGDNAK